MRDDFFSSLLFHSLRENPQGARPQRLPRQNLGHFSP
jgi:hypothetical protein